MLRKTTVAFLHHASRLEPEGQTAIAGLMKEFSNHELLPSHSELVYVPNHHIFKFNTDRGRCSRSMACNHRIMMAKKKALDVRVPTITWTIMEIAFSIHRTIK